MERHSTEGLKLRVEHCAKHDKKLEHEKESL